MKKIRQDVVLVLIYLGILCLLKSGFKFYWQELLILIGGVAGVVLLELDYFLYAFFTRPDDPLSFGTKEAWERKDYKGIIREIGEIREKAKELILHSFLFGPVILVVTLFALTSSGSYFGAGLTLGLFGRYFQETLNMYLKHLKDGVFRERVFWNLKNVMVTEQIQRYFIIGLGTGFLLATIVFIR